MTANPIRRRVVRVVGAVALSLVVLSGCTHAQRPPSSYAGLEDDFVQGCVTVAKGDNEKGESGTTKIASPQNYCQCVFDELSGKNGIPYSEFKKTQSRMQDEGGKIPSSFQKAYDDCDPGSTTDS